jgi:endonuclease G, mitochondrial
MSTHPKVRTIRTVIIIGAVLIIGLAKALSWWDKESRKQHYHAEVESPSTAVISRASSSGQSQQPSPTLSDQLWRPVLRTGLPLKVLNKTWFTIGYDESRKNPAWVTYTLSGPITHPGPEPTRPPTFQTDFATTAHVNHHDYSKSGFDRGHLCPAYAEWSRNGSEAFLSTFVCSNIIPQPHRVNAGIWEELETDIAGRWSGHGGQPAGGGWAEEFGAVTVINGPIYREPTETLRNGTAIPAVDFSVVIRQEGNGYEAEAFEIPNKGDPRGPLDRYLVSIKQVEEDAGLDLFAGEAGALRARLETERAPALWN